MSRHVKPGDPIALGICLGYSIEPDCRWGRLVGIRKDDCKPIHRYIVREYAPGDGEFPTGRYYTVALPFLAAHEVQSEQRCRESDVLRRATVAAGASDS